MKLVVAPDDALKKVCRPVEDFNASLRELVEGMLDVMYTHGGVGLAAPQVGSDLRVIVVDPSAGEHAEACRVMVNPTLVSVSPAKERDVEGCLSLPDEEYEVRRPKAALFRWTDADGSTGTARHEAWLSGREARIALHELDHLEGTLISDIAPRATLKAR